jgi:hypothetical protein
MSRYRRISKQIQEIIQNSNWQIDSKELAEIVKPQKRGRKPKGFNLGVLAPIVNRVANRKEKVETGREYQELRDKGYTRIKALSVLMRKHRAGERYLDQCLYLYREEIKRKARQDELKKLFDQESAIEKAFRESEELLAKVMQSESRIERIFQRLEDQQNQFRKLALSLAPQNPFENACKPEMTRAAACTEIQNKIPCKITTKD